MASHGGHRRVVIVAPSFAPVSNPPTQRVRFFARHLPDFGWEPTVLTVRPEFYEDPLDPDADLLLPPGLEVIRTSAAPAALTRRVGIGDLGIRAYWPMRRALLALCRERRPDLIFIPGPPWHTFLLGPTARRVYGVPFVLDYIDPWVSASGADGRWGTKAYWYRRLAVALEPRAVPEAAHITAVSDGTNEGVHHRYPEIADDRFTTIPYGVEPADFDALRAHPRPNALWQGGGGDGNFHFASVGAMLPRGFETLRALFAAVALLRTQHPTVGPRIRLHFVGTTYEPNPRGDLVMPVARDMGVASVVTEHPARVPYLDALNAMCSADGVLALGSSEPHYTASKIYPSILARRPLLALFHEQSSVCAVLRATNAGELVTYDDATGAAARVSEIAAAMFRLMTPPGYDPSQVQWEATASYTARAMTARLVAVFDRCVDSGVARDTGRRAS